MPEQVWADGQGAAVNREAEQSAWGKRKGHVPRGSPKTVPWDRPFSSKQPMQPCYAFPFPDVRLLSADMQNNANEVIKILIMLKELTAH